VYLAIAINALYNHVIEALNHAKYDIESLNVVHILYAESVIQDGILRSKYQRSKVILSQNSTHERQQ